MPARFLGTRGTNPDRARFGTTPTPGLVGVGSEGNDAAGEDGALNPSTRSGAPRASTGLLEIALIGVLCWTVPQGCASSAAAQLGALPPASQGMDATPEEWRLWLLFEDGKPIEAREAATAWLRDHPDSYVAHFVLGLVQHYTEANFPKALHHLRRARELFERRHGDRPSFVEPWQWHARILREVADVLGAMERFIEQLRVYDEIDERYSPPVGSFRAWPLMKLRRFEAARRAARKGLRSSDPRQRSIALNALCAIEFEAGNDSESYHWCKQAVENGAQHGNLDAVDLGNLAEAARAVFRLDEAERLLLQMSELPVSWHGNPWRELADLYMREARFSEALDALERVPRYRAARPPHVRNTDRTEDRRALAAFLLLLGHEEAAVRLTEQALLRPDRRGHTSRDPAQDRAVTALLDREARLTLAERYLEEASGRPWHQRVLARLKAWKQRFEAWRSGRRALRLLVRGNRLAGFLRLGKAESAITPPWLVLDLAAVTGAAVLRAAVEEARRGDPRPGAGPYYAALRAEIAFERGEWEHVRSEARRALQALPKREALLRARVRLRLARAQWTLGERRAALAEFELVLQLDPGLVRRLTERLPVRLLVRGGPVADAVADAVRRSPRFEVGEQGLSVRIEANESGGNACLLGAGGAQLGCAEVQPKKGESVDALAARLAAALHRKAFAPRIDLSQAQIHSLDGSTRADRGARLDGLLDAFGEREAEPR